MWTSLYFIVSSFIIAPGIRLHFAFGSPPTPRPKKPSARPTLFPTFKPTFKPSARPTLFPTFKPTARPPSFPTLYSTENPTLYATDNPTLYPTGNPTVEPSFSLQSTILFNVTQMMNGPTIFDWTSDPYSSESFIAAIVASINKKATTATNTVNLDSSAVSIVSAQAASSRRQLPIATATNSHLLATGISITYALSVTNQQLGDKYPAVAYSTAVTAISDAITSGVFLNELVVAGTIFGSTLFSSPTAFSSIPIPIFGSVSFTISRSAYPSGQPTSEPSSALCPAGYYHDDNGPHCHICPAGTFSAPGSYSCNDCAPGSASNSPGSASCSPCDVGYFASGFKSLACSQCRSPYSTTEKGSPDCKAIEIALSNDGIGGFAAFAFILYCFCVYLTKNPSLAMFTIFPAMDVVSDIIYVLQTRFYNVGLLTTCIIFIFAPCSIFLQTLYVEGSLVPQILLPVPDWLDNNSLLWLTIHKGNPQFHRETIEWLSFDRLDTIPKLIGYWIIMSCVIASQGSCGVIHFGLYTLYMIFHVPFSIFWLLFGCFLYSIKMLVVGKVWTFWFRVWRRRDLLQDAATGQTLLGEFDHPKGLHDSNSAIATDLLNESLFAEFVSETLPQMIIQGINNQLTGRWTDVAYFSTSFSIFMAMNGVYRYFYYTQFVGVPFSEVPITVTIGTKSFELPFASHKRGVAMVNFGDLTADEIKVREIDRDRRFQELLALLGEKNARRIRDIRRYNPSKVHMFGRRYTSLLQEDDHSVEDKDNEPRVQTKDDKQGVSRDKSHRLSFFGLREFFSKSFSGSLSKADLIELEQSVSWLDDLDYAVATEEYDNLPVLNDLRVFQLVKIFKDHEIVSEKSLQNILLMRQSDSERMEYVRNHLGLQSKGYQRILRCFFGRFWDRIVSEGKGKSDQKVEIAEVELNDDSTQNDKPDLVDQVRLTIVQTKSQDAIISTREARLHQLHSDVVVDVISETNESDISEGSVIVLMS